MRRILMMAAATLTSWCAMAAQWTDPKTGIVWGYTINDGEAFIENEFGGNVGAVFNASGDISVPATLGGCPVTEIGTWAFQGCDKVTSIFIPKSVTWIGSASFDGCCDLLSIIVDDANGFYSSDEGVLLSKEQNAIIRCPEGKVGKYEIPTSVTKITYHAFSGCEKITGVTIPKGVTAILKNTFYGCKSLSTIMLPEGVQDICDAAFYGCSSLKSILFPNGVKSIGQCAFLGCSSLTEIILPDSTTQIGNSAFLDCTGLTDVTLPAKVVVGLGAFEGCNNIVRATLPSSYFTGAFPSAKNSIKEVVICNGVSYIGDYSFYQCYNLESVTIPNSVTEIDRNGFNTCPNLRNIVIPDSVKYIGAHAFYGCGCLTSVNISSNMKTIEEYAFSKCKNLAKVFVDKGDKERVRALYDWDASITFIEQGTSDEKEQETSTPGDSSDDSDEKSGNEKDDSSPATKDSDAEFDGSVKHIFNGLVFDPDGEMCGMAQITTAKATAKGVRVGGFVMLADGKKQIIKSATGTVSGGYLTAKTSVGKLGSMEITIGGNGFKGTLGDMTLATEETDEDTGILSGTLKLSYFDAKTDKVKTKSITVGGVASGGAAVGTATVKGKGGTSKLFAAEIE